MPFRTVLQLLLRKSVKSLQLVLNEWGYQLDLQITASAFSQARQKIRHTAFIELLEKSVVQVMYGDGNFKSFLGHRLVALDGSTLRLPNTKETREKFGVVKYLNGKKTEHGWQVEGKMTVLYDVLNRIPISAHLQEGRMNDLRASKEHLPDLKPEDLLLADRAYGSYQFFGEILGQNANFVIRCKRNIFESCHHLSASKNEDAIVEIRKPKWIESEKVPPLMQVRFVRVALKGGDIEILATSLLDRTKYPCKLFKKLYYQRWNVETYFHTLKSRLNIDNFTGKSVEAILQDFHSTIFVSGLESIISIDSNKKLRNKKTRHPQQVNKAVAFHTIKNHVIRLVFEQPPDFNEQIKTLLSQTPTLIREQREKPPRRESDSGASRRSLYFQRYARKQVF